MASAYAGLCLLTLLVALSAQLEGSHGELRSPATLLRTGYLNKLKGSRVPMYIERNEISESDSQEEVPAAVAPTLSQVLEALEAGGGTGIRMGDRRSKNGTNDFEGQIWAVLVAGSNGYGNYRHQADVCHAYQILRENGVPAENIITLMYDDIAYNRNNPTPGVIINQPGGPNVYEGVAIDYSGEDVTPDTFIKVLLGDAEGLEGVGTGRVLGSGADDHVFVNFVDHGGPGLVGFPETELYASQLKETFKQMYRKDMYAKMVVSVEACFSGSMFENLLPAHWDIFATTASNSEESSYACYFDDSRNAYLGDVYSVRWMENAESVDLEAETLQQQYEIVQNGTLESHVQEYGDTSVESLPVSEFLGDSDLDKLMARRNRPPVKMDAVKVVDVPVKVLERKIHKENNPHQRAQVQRELEQLLEKRAVVTKNMMDILEAVVGSDEKGGKEREIIASNRFKLIDFGCYEQAARFYSKRCYSIAKNSFVANELYKLVNLCERGWPLERIIEGMIRTCKNTSNVVGIH